MTALVPEVVDLGGQASVAVRRRSRPWSLSAAWSTSRASARVRPRCCRLPLGRFTRSYGLKSAASSSTR
ncbi:hypothetical protein [Nonomuraea sp. WAC 01424]|uniref:hypothetical protein n=1 Tax=Nonomuraea sp. WAC 01424 TaxID=2203200 RepID=UPI000F7916C9|nr:hypothetical protein [Nonomuraea sp. WAC 01424]